MRESAGAPVGNRLHSQEGDGFLYALAQLRQRNTVEPPGKGECLARRETRVDRRRAAAR
jgi:hypothetical protein